MAGTTKTHRSYPFADFPNTKVNAAILAAQIAASSPPISRSLDHAATSGTTCELVFNGLLVAADETQLDALVAAHTGADFASLFQRAASEGNSTNDTVNDVEKVSLSTGALPQGFYQVAWYAELAATSSVANTGASGGFTAAKNGGAAVEAGRSINDLTIFTSFSGSYTFEAAAGESYVFALVFKRLGASSNPAIIRRARIFLSPQSN